MAACWLTRGCMAACWLARGARACILVHVFLSSGRYLVIPQASPFSVKSNSMVAYWLAGKAYWLARGAGACIIVHVFFSSGRY